MRWTMGDKVPTSPISYKNVPIFHHHAGFPDFMFDKDKKLWDLIVED